MTSVTTFDSTKESLLDLLRSIKAGKTQLPDFQRGWVWDDEHIRSLLASISLAYPIGAVMMLQTGNTDVQFKARPIEGVRLDQIVEPERLILDGQQRLTSLFQSLFSGQYVLTRDVRGKQICRWYYIDINKAINSNCDREETIVSLAESKQIKNFRGEVIVDYSTPEKEYEAGLFPLSQIFDCSNWRAGHDEFWDYDKDKIKLFIQFEKEVIKRFEQYQVPVISLGRETPKEAVCQVFEKVNTGGVSLTVFELLTATFAAEDFLLRQDWENRVQKLHKYNVLNTIENTDFLQAVTLVTSYERHQLAVASGTQPDKLPGIGCKRRDILRLTLVEYKNWADRVTKGFEEAARLLYGQNIFAARDIPYKTQLIPLASILTVLGDQAQSLGIKAKLTQWYWCGVLGELYGSAVESRFAKDLPEVLSWVSGGSEPDTIATANFVPTRLLSLRTRNSAAYKGIYALLLRDGGLDFRTGTSIDEQIYFGDKIDIHHIFPQSWCQKRGIDSKRYDSIVNKTPLSYKTNRQISDKAPSLYLSNIQKTAGISEAQMDTILQSHVIDPSTLRGDDFDAFFHSRESALLERISKAMGKPIQYRLTHLVDYDLFDSGWHLLIQSLSKIEGISIEAGSDVQQNGCVIGSYLADVAREGQTIRVLSDSELNAEQIKSVLEQEGAKVVKVNQNQLELGLAAILMALSKDPNDDSLDELDSVSDEKNSPVSFHKECIVKIEKHLKKKLISKTRTTYTADDSTVSVVCAVSKNHDDVGHPSYWFAFHPSQKEFLQNSLQGYLALGCGNEDQLILIPFNHLAAWLEDFWTTEREDRMYWHIRVHKEGESFGLDRKQGKGRINVTPYLIKTEGEA